MAFNVYEETNKRYELFKDGNYNGLFDEIDNDYNGLKESFKSLFIRTMTSFERIKYATLALQSNVQKAFKSFLFNYLTSEEKSIVLNNIITEQKQVNISIDDVVLDNHQMNFIKEHITDFATVGFNIYDLKETFGTNSDILNQLNAFFDNHQDRINDVVVKRTPSDIYKEYGEIISLIIMDIMKNENASFSDVKLVEKDGQHSTVIIIKDKVLKIGYDRSTKRFPNNPYIITPLLRKSFNKNNVKLFIEVTERVMVDDDYNSYSADELYLLYKNLRDLGLVWTDIGSRNVGRLLKDNVIHWNRELHPSDEVLELEQMRGEDVVLKAGDLVLLDADYIYDENDSTLKDYLAYEDDDYYYDDEESDGINFKSFEERYQREKSMKR